MKSLVIVILFAMLATMPALAQPQPLPPTCSWALDTPVPYGMIVLDTDNAANRVPANPTANITQGFFGNSLAGNYRLRAVAPGEVVSLLGLGIGLQPDQYATTIPLPTEIGGMSLLINGAPAPMLYAGSRRQGLDFLNMELVVQVPFNVTGKTIEVVPVGTKPDGTKCAGRGSPFELALVPATPAIYPVLVDAVSYIQLDSDHPLRSGYVALWGSGFGPLSQPATAGTPFATANPLSDSTVLTLTVDGQTATTVYVGGAPGQVGLYEFIAKIPAGGTGKAELKYGDSTIAKFQIPLPQ